MGCAASTSAVDAHGARPAPVVLLASPAPRPELEGGNTRRRRRSSSAFEGEDAPFWKVKLRAPGSEVPALAAIQDKYGDAAVDHVWLELGEYKGVPMDDREDEDQDEAHYFPEGHVAARWRNLQALVEQVESAPPSFGAALEAMLALRAELARYNKESRLLLQLAHTGYFVALSERFEAMLDALFATYGLPQSGFWMEWPRALRRERERRVDFFRELLEDAARMRQEVGDERQQLEIMTLIKYDVTTHAARMTQSELQLVADVYEHIATESGTVLLALPHWFTPPCEILVHQQQRPEDEGASTEQLSESYETWGGRRVATIVVPREWSEEFFIWQASRWAELRHAHVLAMLGACHVGPDMFYIHEEVMGVDKLFLEGAPKWRILYQVALGLQYLHERGLVHAGALSMDSIIISSGNNKGLLTGVGWVPHAAADASDRDSAAREYARQFVFGGTHYLNGDAVDAMMLPPSVLNDLSGFGRCVEGVLRGEAWRQSGYPNEFPTELNVDGLAGQLVKRLSGLEASTSGESQRQVALSEAVQLLEELSVQEHKLALGGTGSNDSNGEGDAPLPQLLLDVNTFAIGTVGAPLVNVMENVRALTERVAVDFGDITLLNHQVYLRFADLYAHVTAQANGIFDAIFLRSFGPLLECFCGILERFEERQGQYTNVLWSLATRKASEDYIALHHRMDRLLTLLELEKPSEVHDWRSQWDQIHTSLRECAIKVLSDTEAIVSSVVGDQATYDEGAARFVVGSLLFELTKHRSSYPDEAVRPMTLASIELAQYVIQHRSSGKKTKKNGKSALFTYESFLPRWFIPAYEVLYSSLYEKIPNQVYLGDWFDSPTIVYKTVGKATAANTERFSSMVEQYVRIDHPNVIRTYGACHVGSEQLLLCEMTRTSSLKDLVAGGSTHPAFVWSYIRDATMGLQYLHERGIVHGGLQNSVIMLGTDNKIKITEFGMRARNTESGPEADSAASSSKRSGMSRWTAPEVLEGDSPTPESDIYALGMCIVEALTCEEPWGPDVSEVAVISAVKKGHLQPRPQSVSSEHWALVRRMCRYEPSERTSLAAVIAWATNAAREAALPVLSS
jgi:serine/threonine protein kinase